MKTTVPPCQAPAKLGKPRFSEVSEENRLGVAGNVSFPAKTGCQAPAKLGKARFSEVSEENRLGVAGNVSFPAKTGCKTYAKLGKTANRHPQGGGLSKSYIACLGEAPTERRRVPRKS